MRERAARGRFIVIEGPDGAGKSTQLALLRERLTAGGHDALLTGEPGGTPAGEAIRGVVLDPAYEVGPLAEFLLYSAARAQHVEEVIAPALSAGRDVISDRFASASVAYQGYGRGLELDLVHQINATVVRGLKPDLTLLLDLDPAQGLERAARRAKYDRLEAEGLAFHERVRRGYLLEAGKDASWRVISANAPEAEVHEQIWAAVEELLAPSSREGV